MQHTDNAAFVTQWVLDTVKKDYAQDIALVAAHNTLRLDGANEPPRMSYFVPITDRGRRFAQTFILGEEGFDIWGIEWARLERFAALEEYNLTCLADASLLYARTQADADRFAALQQTLWANLADPQQRRAHALACLNEAKQLYLQLQFAQGGDAAMYAGYLLDDLARALCFAQGGIFHAAQTDQLAELRRLGPLPEGFAEGYARLPYTVDAAGRCDLCHSLIALVENWLRPTPPPAREHNFQDLADWYAELSLTWLRIRRLAAAGDVTKVYMWGCMLQNELNTVCQDFGLEKMDLLSAFRPQDLGAFAAHADALEAEMRRRIQNGGGHIRQYRSQADLLRDDPYEV